MSDRYFLSGLTKAELQRCLEALGIPEPDDLTYYDLTQGLCLGQCDDVRADFRTWEAV